MSEIIYSQKYSHISQIQAIEKQMDLHFNIKWLETQNYRVFCEHLKLCHQNSISDKVWSDIEQSGTIYCGIFVGNKMVARAAVEKYSDDTWEVADVRTANEYRGRGYAHQLCLFVLYYIFKNEKNATMRTEDDNFKMQHIIKKLGFEMIS